MQNWQNRVFYILVSIFISLGCQFVLKADKIQDTDNLAGVWFNEFDKDKLIAIFTEGDITGEGQQTVLYHTGMFTSFACTMKDGKLIVAEDSIDLDLHFFNEDILMLKNKDDSPGLVFKRLKDPLLLNQVDNLLTQYYKDLIDRNINKELRQSLKDEIKRSISWDQIHLPIGEHIGWVKKKERLDWEKKMRASGKEIKFPFPSVEDYHSLAMIKGKWLINNKHTFIFTDTFVGEVIGVKLYRMEMVNRPGHEGYDPAYTVLIHEKDGHSYLHIAFWQFEFQRPIRIEFQGSDNLVTYDKGQMDGQAVRLK